MEITARVRRSGEWWAIDIPEVPGAFTQAAELSEVADCAADAVALLLDLRPDALKVTIEVVPPKVRD